MKQHALRAAVLWIVAFAASPSNAFQAVTVRPTAAIVRLEQRRPNSFVYLKDAASHFPDSSSNTGPDTPPTTTDSDSDLDGESATFSLLRKIDEVGLGLKPAAKQANAKAALAETRMRTFLYIAKSCALFTLFILYRAYRGFFVIVPEVFRSTFRKLEAVVDEAPFDDDYIMETPVAEKNKKYPWRTRITISVLAAVVTASYMLGGAIRVGLKLIKSFLSGGNSVSQSFEAAASEQELNEHKILRLAQNKSKQQNVNGEEGLAP